MDRLRTAGACRGKDGVAAQVALLRQARRMRSAISPRLAISTLSKYGWPLPVMEACWGMSCWVMAKLSARRRGGGWKDEEETTAAAGHCPSRRIPKLHRCIALHCVALHCIALHCIALHCTAPARRCGAYARGALRPRSRKHSCVYPRASCRFGEAGAPHLHHIRNTPKRVASIGAFKAADNPRPSTRRVSAGSMMPSSHRRALA